jgi:hypothetical protein
LHGDRSRVLDFRNGASAPLESQSLLVALPSVLHLDKRSVQLAGLRVRRVAAEMLHERIHRARQKSARVLLEAAVMLKQR